MWQTSMWLILFSFDACWCRPRGVSDPAVARQQWRSDLKLFCHDLAVLVHVAVASSAQAVVQRLHRRAAVVDALDRRQLQRRALADARQHALRSYQLKVDVIIQRMRNGDAGFVDGRQPRRYEIRLHRAHYRRQQADVLAHHRQLVDEAATLRPLNGWQQRRAIGRPGGGSGQRRWAQHRRRVFGHVWAIWRHRLAVRCVGCRMSNQARESVSANKTVCV